MGVNLWPKLQGKRFHENLTALAFVKPVLPLHTSSYRMGTSVLEIAGGHRPFSDQFQHMAGQTYCTFSMRG